MNSRKGSESEDYTPDLTHFIRSLQRIEGNPDCFNTAKRDCDRLDCVWRTYCLEDWQAQPG